MTIVYHISLLMTSVNHTSLLMTSIYHIYILMTVDVYHATFFLLCLRILQIVPIGAYAEATTSSHNYEQIHSFS